MVIMRPFHDDVKSEVATRDTAVAALRSLTADVSQTMEAAMRRVWLATSLAIGFCITCAGVAAAEERSGWVFYTGDSFLHELITENPTDTEVFYVAGLSDAFVTAAVWGFTGPTASDDDLRWLADCVDGKSARQLTAIYTKWLKANPEQWHRAAGILFQHAMWDACEPQKQE